MAGVYLSYPFCGQKCTFCNFASGVFPRGLDTLYLETLHAELSKMQWPWTPETVYLGGGTPSQMDASTLASLLREIPGRPWREATIEAAPGTITLEKAMAWRRAGIDRISLGVQSFVTAELVRTGRRHTAEIVEAEVRILREAGFDAISVDLIAGLPGQTRATWITSLEWLERLNMPHASVYMLEVDQDSRLGKEILAKGVRYGAADVPADDEIASFYEIALERLKLAGLPRYEISNFARPGHESLHNLKYWRREPYLGFGADAHSFDGVWRWQNVESATEYVERRPAPERTLADPLSESLFLGLRLSEGIDADWTPFADAMEQFARDGLIQIEGRRVRLTDRGVMLSNEVFAEFVGVPA